MAVETRKKTNKFKVSIVVPVYNEEKDLARNIPILYQFLRKKFQKYDWRVIIANNGPSTDKTDQTGRNLSRRYEKIDYTCILKPGRGNALKTVWESENADYLCYMDIDLSSDLSYLPDLIDGLQRNDIAIGSRLKKGAKIYGRTLTREVMSRGYNLLIKFLFWTKFHDAQCGFKAITKKAANKLLPAIEDEGWFFDSELLIIAAKAGFKIIEIPIVWRDDPSSTVKVAKTAWGDIKGLLRLFTQKPWRNLINNDF